MLEINSEELLQVRYSLSTAALPREGEGTFDHYSVILKRGNGNNEQLPGCEPKRTKEDHVGYPNYFSNEVYTATAAICILQNFGMLSCTDPVSSNQLNTGNHRKHFQPIFMPFHEQNYHDCELTK